MEYSGSQGYNPYLETYRRFFLKILKKYLAHYPTRDF